MLLSCGDALIDMLPVTMADGTTVYRPRVGGSCLNVAIAMARLGAPAGFAGAFSTDAFGIMIATHAEASGVDLGLAQRNAQPTTLAFVHRRDGQPSYSFYDEDSASRHWTHTIPRQALASVAGLHVGSTTLIADAPAGETLRLVADARASATVSFDPNCRPTLVADPVGYRDRMQAFAAQADIVRLSDEDWAFLFGDKPADAVVDALLADAVLVVRTHGSGGVTAWHRTAGRLASPGRPVTVVDTIGAGDTFMGALLAALWRGGHLPRRALAACSAAELDACLALATRCAAITCSREGCDPPTWAEAQA